MKRTICLVFFMLMMVGSCSYRAVDYKPDLSNVSDPLTTLKMVVESQPASYAYLMPSKVEVDDECIRIYETSDATILFMTIYFKNIGNFNLYEKKDSSVWYIEILDLSGTMMYRVFTFYEDDAKGFMDAMALQVGKNAR